MIFFDISISSVFEKYKDDAHSVNKTCEIRRTARNKIKSRVCVKYYVHEDFCFSVCVFLERAGTSMIRLLEWMRKTCFKLSTGLLKTHPHTLIYVPSVFLHLKPVCQPLRSSFLKKKPPHTPGIY